MEQPEYVFPAVVVQQATPSEKSGVMVTTDVEGGGMAFATIQAGSPVPVDKVVDGGPGLAFVAFPYALAQLPYSAWFSLVFFLALFGALEPAILFILPSLLFTLLLLSAVALWLFAGTSVGPGQDRLEYLETALPWFGAYNWCAQLVQFFTGAVCLVAYVRFVDREPQKTQVAPWRR